MNDFRLYREFETIVLIYSSYLDLLVDENNEIVSQSYFSPLNIITQQPAEPNGPTNMLCQVCVDRPKHIHAPKIHTIGRDSFRRVRDACSLSVDFYAQLVPLKRSPVCRKHKQPQTLEARVQSYTRLKALAHRQRKCPS